MDPPTYPADITIIINPSDPSEISVNNSGSKITNVNNTNPSLDKRNPDMLSGSSVKRTSDSPRNYELNSERKENGTKIPIVPLIKIPPSSNTESTGYVPYVRQSPRTPDQQKSKLNTLKRTQTTHRDVMIGGGAKSIQRRGNTYLVRDLPISEDSADEDDMAETDVIEKMINDLYDETLHLSGLANNKATLFKYIYVISTLFVIIAGAVIGVLSSQDSMTDSAKIVVSVFGFVITGIGTFMTTFSVEKRGVLLKDVSNKLRKISRQIKSLQYSDIEPHNKMLKLEEFYAEVDDMDMSIYDNKMTSSPLTKSIKIRPEELTPRISSDLPIKDQKIFSPNSTQAKTIPKRGRDIRKQIKDPDSSIIIDMNDSDNMI